MHTAKVLIGSDYACADRLLCLSGCDFVSRYSVASQPTILSRVRYIIYLIVVYNSQVLEELNKVRKLHFHIIARKNKEARKISL